MKIKEFAEQLYSTYVTAVGGTAYNGYKLPSWEEFSADPSNIRQVKGWICIALQAHRVCELNMNRVLAAKGADPDIIGRLSGMLKELNDECIKAISNDDVRKILNE